MKRIIILLLFIITISVFVESCGKCDCLPVKPDPCSGLSFKFSTDIKPIINTTCAFVVVCHGTGSINKGGPLTTYTEIFNKRAEIKIQVVSGSMPQPPITISAEDKQKLICWLDSGAPNN